MGEISMHLKTYLFIILAGIILFSLTAVGVRYSREIKAAHGRINGRSSQVITRTAARLEYAMVGDGYPVLVIHGTMGGYDQGLLVAKPVIDAGFQVIAVSRFGYLAFTTT